MPDILPPELYAVLAYMGIFFNVMPALQRAADTKAQQLILELGPSLKARTLAELHTAFPKIPNPNSNPNKKELKDSQREFNQFMSRLSLCVASLSPEIKFEELQFFYVHLEDTPARLLMLVKGLSFCPAKGDKLSCYDFSVLAALFSFTRIGGDGFPRDELSQLLKFRAEYVCHLTNPKKIDEEKLVELFSLMKTVVKALHPGEEELVAKLDDLSRTRSLPLSARTQLVGTLTRNACDLDPTFESQYTITLPWYNDQQHRPKVGGIVGEMLHPQLNFPCCSYKLVPDGPTYFVTAIADSEDPSGRPCIRCTCLVFGYIHLNTDRFHSDADILPVGQALRAVDYGDDKGSRVGYATSDAAHSRAYAWFIAGLSNDDSGKIIVRVTAPNLVPPLLWSAPASSTVGNSNVQQWKLKLAVKAREDRKEADFRYNNNNKTPSGNISFPKLRSYQQNCYDQLESNLSVRAHVLYLPTGAGKTVVALHWARRALHDCPNKKVVFLAPTNLLVLQQEYYFTSHLNQPHSTLTMEEELNETPIPSGSRLLFCTPGCFKNALENNDNLSLVEPAINLDDVSLVIFDEAHATRKSAPYHDIAKMIRASVAASNGTSALRVLGLTATPCAHDKYATEVDFMNGYRALLENIAADPMCSATFVCPAHEYMEELQDYVSKVESDVWDWTRDEHERDMFELLTFAASQLNHIARIALCVLKVLGAPAAAVYLTDCFQFVEHPMPLSVGQMNQVKMARERNRTSPYLSSLTETLLSKLDDSAADSILVLTQEKLSARLFDWALRHRQHKLSSDFITGQSDSLYMKGMSQSMLGQKRSAFSRKEGNTNILVATDVVEEGLDVSRCRMVVRTEPSQTVRKCVQARGRIREVNYHEAKYAVLTENPDEQKKAEKNALGNLLVFQRIYSSIRKETH